MREAEAHAEAVLSCNSRLQPTTTTSDRFRCLPVPSAAGIPAAATGLQYWFDLTGSSTFTALALVSLGLGSADTPPSHLLVALAVALWATRLGTFLFSRIIQDGGIDHRLSKYTKSPVRFLLGPWTVQGLWVVATMLPIIVLLAGRGPTEALPSSPMEWVTKPLHYLQLGAARFFHGVSALRPADVESLPAPVLVLLAVWSLAWLAQVLADEQKRQFKADEDNKGRWIDSGIWSYSQHPNYAAEMVLWLALGGAAAHLAYTDPLHTLHGSKWAYASLVGPCLEACLLLFLSGVPLLDKAAAAKWGHRQAWREFATRTPVLFPCCPAFPRRPTAYIHDKDD